MQRIRNSLGRYAPSGYTKEQIRERADALGRDAWRGSGLLCVQIDDPRLTWPQREIIKQIARALNFGEIEK